MSVVKHNKQSEIEIQRNFAYRGLSMQRYSVTLRSGSWPTDQDLIDMCDGGSSHFGGKVERRGLTTAEVTVYVD